MNVIPTVYLVDDDPSVLRSLGRLVASAGYQAMAYESADQFLSHHRSDAPSCLVLDLQLPGLSGLELQQRLSDGPRKLPIVFLTGHGDFPACVRAIQAGAVDFLTKPCRDRDLLGAIDLALAKDAEARRALAHKAEQDRLLSALTTKERQVLHLVAAGRLNKQIAAELGVCEQTVKVHRMHIMQKLHAKRLADLLRLVEIAGTSPNKS